MRKLTKSTSENFKAEELLLNFEKHVSPFDNMKVGVEI